MNGKLDYDIFLQSYNFLDAKQEMEMKKLEKRIKKTKGQDKKTKLKQSYHRIKQDLLAKRRHVNLKEKLKETKKEHCGKKNRKGRKVINANRENK